MESELKELLEGISDVYEDFAFGVCMGCKTDSERQKLIDYIKENKEVTTSDVLIFLYDEITSKRKKI
ncbi:MAG: hypothetical protein LUG91_10220 [Ruminococcus sp.]|nr:hypothetical protein [Ruminococcus sp.]